MFIFFPPYYQEEREQKSYLTEKQNQILNLFIHRANGIECGWFSGERISDGNENSFALYTQTYSCTTKEAMNLMQCSNIHIFLSHFFSFSHSIEIRISLQDLVLLFNIEDFSIFFQRLVKIRKTKTKNKCTSFTNQARNKKKNLLQRNQRCMRDWATKEKKNIYTHTQFVNSIKNVVAANTV